VRRIFLYRPLFMLLLFSHLNMGQLAANQTQWTEERIGKLAVKADQAATRNKLSRAIKYGEKMLQGSRALYGPEDPNYINRLKTQNRYYDKAGRLQEVSERVKTAYLLSKKHFALTHDTSVISRLLYYKLLIAQKDYQSAIPLVLENIATLRNTVDDDFRKLHYLQQLHGLYGLTSQYEEQEKLLFKLLALNKRLIGSDTSDNIEIIMNLAKVYCLQNRGDEFQKLMKSYNLQYVC